MNKIKTLLPGLAALALAMPATAQKGAGPKAGGGKTSTASLPAPKKLTSVEGITEYELANGLHVLLFPDPSKPTMTVNITYKVGSRMEGYGETGMAHLLEHMVFKGSTGHTNIPQELSSHGANPNGTTSDDRTNYFETFNASDENLNWALSLESDRMINSFIAEKDLRSEFTVVRNEFERGENDPSGILRERILSSAYLWHNYGKSTIGSKEDIEKVPIKNLQAFYRKYYQPDNAVLLVAGKIDEAKTLELVNKYFGPIPRPARVLDQTYTVEPTQDGERFVELRRSGDVQSVACAFHIVSGSHADYPIFDVLSEILTDEPNGRLYQSLVKTGKASTVWSYAADLKDPGYMYINADVLKEKSIEDARKAFYASLDELGTKPVTQEEVDKAKTSLLRNVDELFRNSARVGITLSNFIGQGDWRLAFLYRDNLKKVTAADVNRIAAKYLLPSNRTVGVFIPTDNAKRTDVPPPPDVAALVANYKGGPAISQGEAFDATPANIDARTERGTMASGAKYALLPKSTRGNSVTANIVLRIGDDASLRGKSAVSDLTADMLKRGTQNKTQAQIDEALDKLSSRIDIGTAGQNITVSVTSTRANLPAALDIVDELLHRPSFPAEEFKTLTAEYASALEGERNEPQSLASREFQRALSAFPKGHILYMKNVDEELADYKAVTLDDVRKFYADYYNGSAATVSVVGDFDPVLIKQKLDKTLANWTAIKPYTRIPNPYVEIPLVNKEYKTPDKKNAMYMAGTGLKIRDDNPDYPALMMANYILGGGFLNSRLATRIRQKEGLSYGVGSQLSASGTDERGVFLSYAIYNPENKEKVEAAWKDELKKAVTEGFTEAELADAKSGLLQSRATSRANDGAVASTLSNYLFLNRTMAFDKSLDDRIAALTLAEVNNALKKYVNPDKITYIKAGDFK